jgi:hypothetical protein
MSLENMLPSFQIWDHIDSSMRIDVYIHLDINYILMHRKTMRLKKQNGAIWNTGSIS